MSRELAGLSYVVLTLVGRDGAGPHDLVRMARAGQRLWWVGAASKIYEQPRWLQDRGYLRSEKRPGKTRPRTHYMLTEKGLTALREWLVRAAPVSPNPNEAARRAPASA